jgi:hypothetical protein
MTKKVTISGTPRKYDPIELSERQAGFHAVYKQTDQCYQVVHGSIPFELLTKVIAHHDKGYKLSPKYPVSFDPMSYSIRMEKPDHLQQVDLKEIDERIKLEYIAELEAEIHHFRHQVAQQLVDADAAKEQKKQDQLKAKRLVEIESEVNSLFKDLIVPD